MQHAALGASYNAEHALLLPWCCVFHLEVVHILHVPVHAGALSSQQGVWQAVRQGALIGQGLRDGRACTDTQQQPYTDDL
jgi:hypothetical protein